MSEISFSEALEIINRKDKHGNPVPFTVDFFTLNRNTKKGGKITRWKNAKLLSSVKGKGGLHSAIKQASSIDTVERNPNHWKNRTRNLELEDGKKRKIHLRLIDSINGNKVVP